MNTTQASFDRNESGAGSVLRRYWWALVGLAAVAVGLGVVFAVTGESQAKLSAQYSVSPVKRGPLTISVPTSGSVRSAEAITITNEVEGRTQILWIIEEGTEVKEGDLLLELDSSELEERKLDQEISVKSADANVTTAELNVEIAKKEGESSVQAALVQLELAILDLEKYVGVGLAEMLGVEQETGATVHDRLQRLATAIREADIADLDPGHLVSEDKPESERGEYDKLIKQARNSITLTESQLERAVDKLNGSIKLEEKGYITEFELRADELEHERYQLDKELAEIELALLQRFTKRRTLSELKNAVEQAAFDLEKTIKVAESNVIDAEAKLDAQRLTLGRQQERLEKIDRHLAACKVYSPADGMVVYGTSGEQSRYSRQEPLEEGVEVRERQELFRIPKAGGMVAEVKIHESALGKVEEGLPVEITVDSMASKKFRGVVGTVALVPDAQDRWMNPDMKVYNTEINIDESASESLRPGMSCNAEIVVARYDDALYIPLQSVHREGARSTVYVMGSDGPEARRVELGLDNNKVVRVVSGLEDGEMVVMNPPLDQAERPNDLGEEYEQTQEDVEVAEERAEEREAARRRARQEANPERAAEAAAESEEEGAGRWGQGRGGEGFGGNVDWQNLTDEQRQQMRERRRGQRGGEGNAGPGGRGGFDPSNLTEEQRQRMERFRNMSDEERRAFFQSEEGQRLRQRFGGRRGGGEGGGGGRGADGGGGGE